MLALQWRDVDWLDRKLRVNKSVWNGKLSHSTKTDVDLVKHLPEVLVRALEEHRERSHFTEPADFIFSKRDGAPCDPANVLKTVLYPAMDRAGIERGRRTHGFHIFRHLAGSIVHKRTGSMKLAQLQLGHANMAITSRVYVHTDEEQRKLAAEVLADAISPVLPTSLPTN